MITTGWYKQHFEVKSMTIAFTTFAGERRRDKLREWALRELQGEGRRLASGFLFTAQQQPPDSQHMWLNPCWYTPFMDDKPVAMLAK
jgi:hypothetical protein